MATVDIDVKSEHYLRLQKYTFYLQTLKTVVLVLVMERLTGHPSNVNYGIRKITLTQYPYHTIFGLHFLILNFGRDTIRHHVRLWYRVNADLAAN